MTSFKSTSPVRLCTSLDVRMLSEHLRKGIYGLPTEDIRVLISDQEIDNLIAKLSGKVNTMLQKVSGGVTGLYTTPVCGNPVANFQNVGSDSQIEDLPRLEGLTVGSGAITELWTLIFTSTTAYDVRGSISGAQGSGTTGGNFTATDSDITIPSGAWYLPTTGSGFNPGDRVYIPVWRCYLSVVEITSKLVCADVVDRFFSEISPNRSESGKAMREEAMKMLKDLNDSVTQLDDGTTPAYEWVQVPYGVSALGDDLTDYSDEDTVGSGEVIDAFNKDLI